MFVNDHLQNFPYSNMPAFCVGLCDRLRRAERRAASTLMRIPPRTRAGPSARGPWRCSRAGSRRGIDFAYSYEIESWDELAVPLHFLLPDGDVPIVHDLHELRGAAAADAAALSRRGRARRRVRPLAPVGRARRADRHPAASRTGSARRRPGASIPTGITGCSTTSRAAISSRSCSLTHDEIERDGGNGGQEIRNWMALLGAVPGWKGEVLAYEPVDEWITGCGAVWVHP